MQTPSSVITSPAPALPPADPAWDEAFLRVESYLHAHHLESRMLLNALATEIIGEARERVRVNPAETPVGAALQVTRRRIGAWFASAGHAEDWADERVRVRGRLALVLADVPGHWAQWFLSPAPVPPALASALASGVLQAGPELRFSNMPPAPLEFGFEAPDDGRFRKPPRGQTLCVAAMWLSIVGVYGVMWAATH